MQRLLKSLIEKRIIDYKALVLEYYYRFGLNEDEAIALIKLNELLEEKRGIIKPETFCKRLSKTSEETADILNGLMNKGYLRIKLVENAQGKDQETFDIDMFLLKVVETANQARKEVMKTETADWVEFLEATLQQPLSRLDLETVAKWLEEDMYPFDKVKAATFEALKKPRPSIRTIDRILLDTGRVPAKKPVKKNVLKEFYKLWEE